MRFAALAVVGWFLAAVCTCAMAQQPPADAELARKIDALILQLDSDSFEARESAEKQLLALGDKAKDAVTKATRSTSAEVRQRAGRILRELRKGTVDLKHLAIVKRGDMLGACGLDLSVDGKFVYAASWQSGSIAVFRRDGATGQLTHVQSLVDPAHLKGITCIRISPDGKLALATAFGSKKVSLLARDAEAGMLTMTHQAGPELGAGLALKFPVQADFSPDCRFVYAVDDQAGALHVFEVADGRLKWLQTSQGPEGSFNGTRALAISPDGKSLVVAGTRAGKLTLLDRNPATGLVEVRQVLADGKDSTGLAGVHDVNVSPDGKHVYTTSGRFSGDQGIGAYRFGVDGNLILVSEFASDASDLVNFAGGNKGTVSPDGLSFYACGTTSQSLACFRRDPATGELTFQATIHDESTGKGDKTGPANALCSPDGRFAYVTLESAGAISIFERTAPK